jgi:hypothetical protein
MTDPRSKKIIMVTDISGSRGEDMWPGIGGKLTVGYAEAMKLIGMGVAVEDPDQSVPVPESAAGKQQAAWPPPAETAVYEPGEEKRAEQPGTVESDRVKETPPESPLTQVAPRRGPGRPRKDSLPS